MRSLPLLPSGLTLLLAAVAGGALAQPAAPHGGGLTFYATRAEFDAAHPGLYVEDFEDVEIAGYWCASYSPVTATTDDECYDPGTLVAPLGLAAFGPTQWEWDALIAHSAGYFGQPSIVVGANLEVDTTAVWFHPGVSAVGMEVYAYFGNPGITVDVYDTAGALLGSTTVPGDTTGTFFGVSADGAAIGTIRLDADDDYTLVDDVAYGTSLVGVEPPPDETAPFGLVVHPNPFRGTGTVTLTLARAAEVEAALYDALGRRVAVVASGRFSAGRHEVALEAGHLPAGTYVVRAEAGGTVRTQQLTLVR